MTRSRSVPACFGRSAPVFFSIAVCRSRPQSTGVNGRGVGTHGGPGAAILILYFGGKNVETDLTGLD